jgi:hypothetical protein
MKKIKTYTEPPFWDNFIGNEPITQSLLKNYEEIKKEALRMKIYAGFLLYTKYSVPKLKLKFNKNIQHYFIDDSTIWRISPFFGSRYDNNARRRSTTFKLLYADALAFFVRLICPKTYSLLKEGFKNKIILNAYFTELVPGSIIKPHIHPQSNGIHRMNLHLGLVCDPECVITVGEETRTWEEGNILAFKNSGPYRHSVIHRGIRNRIVLIVELDVKYLEPYGVFKGNLIKN